MKFRRILLRRLIAFSLLCDAVDNHRSVQQLRVGKHLDQLLQVVAVDRPEIDKPQLFKKYARHHGILDGVPQRLQTSEKRIAHHRNAPETLLQVALQIVVAL